MSMSRMNRTSVCVVLSGLLILGLSGVLQAAETAGTTLENLQAAFNGESNARARYLAFAQKADEEGYGAVASLFRAASKAEEIHANTHAQVIKSMGGVPKADIQKAVVKTTRENLQAAIGGESYERDTMYPAFIEVARKDKNKAALRTFNFAKGAETGHAKIYAEILAKLDSLKGSKKTDYQVCTECGYTVAQINFDKCPNCFEPISMYMVVN
ncbi:MAG TPA: rubrerythrin family protein [Acidobacteriota bacterium]|mgnify:CR=1 FL=1|nr:rubrerythrin family protein [Acidobacteriota bacterium]HQG90812.1 rubrerythrin family protein [Acidobacteriota bacterium]